MASCGLKVVVLLLVSLFATIDCHVQESVSDHNHDYSNEHQHLNEEHSHTHHQHEHGDNDPDVSQSGTSCTETEATWQVWCFFICVKTYITCKHFLGNYPCTIFLLFNI